MKIIEKTIKEMMTVNDDKKQPLKLKKIKMTAEFKIPFIAKGKIEGEFEIKK